MLTEIQVDETRVVAWFDRMPDAVRGEMVKVVQVERLVLEALVKRKLSGEVLNVVTGRLRRSIFSDVEARGDAVTGTVSQSGDVPYGARHEFGFTGAETVAAHVRTITQAFGHAIAPRVVEVQSFTRTAHTPERSFLRSSLADRTEAIVAALKGAVARGTAP